MSAHDPRHHAPDLSEPPDPVVSWRRCTGGCSPGAGVCSATLGPDAITPLLGTADATTNSTPFVALAAQGP